MEKFEITKLTAHLAYYNDRHTLMLEASSLVTAARIESLPPFLDKNYDKNIHLDLKNPIIFNHLLRNMNRGIDIKNYFMNLTFEMNENRLFFVDYAKVSFDIETKNITATGEIKYPDFLINLGGSEYESNQKIAKILDEDKSIKRFLDLLED